MGYVPPTKDSFASITPKYLKHQKARLSAESYERTNGIIENQLAPYFGEMQLGGIRRTEIQQYVTKRAAEVSAGSVVKELNVLKHLMGLAGDWEFIPFS